MGTGFVTHSSGYNKIYCVNLVYCSLQNNYIIVIKIQMTPSKLATFTK
jgi:hypothetical protein